MLKYLAMAVLILAAFNGMGQKIPEGNITYTDERGNVCKKRDAMFVNTVWNDQGRWHKQQAVYDGGLILLDAWYDDIEMKILDGPLMRYEPATGKKINVLWVKGVPHEEGYMAQNSTDSSVFEWHRLDSTLSFKRISDQQGNGRELFYNKTGKMTNGGGLIQQYKRQGEWMFKDSNNVTGVVVNYNDSRAEKISCFNEKGLLENKGDDCVIEKIAEFPGGALGWQRFLEKNLQYPDEARDRGIMGIVRIQFFVETDGSLTDISILESRNSALANEALRIFKISPKWQPALQFNRVIRYKNVQAINFRLE